MKKHLLIAAATLFTGFAPALAAIPSGFSVTPDNGATVAELTTISVYNRSGYMEPYVVNRYISINGEHYTFTAKASGQMDETLTFTLSSPVVQSGDYEIIIPEATFTTGWNEDDNPEISWKITIDNPDHPVVSGVEAKVTPESGTELTELSSIRFDFEDAEKVVADASAAVSITGPNGAVESTISFTTETSAAVMNISPALNGNGAYAVNLPAGVFTVTAGGIDTPSSAMSLNYVVKGMPQAGEKIKAGDLYYKVVSPEEKTLSVTWPPAESEYNGITAVPEKAVYNGVEYTVVEIGDLAFSEVTGLTSMTVPASVTVIGEGAFWDSSLKEITLPATLTEIQGSAFEDCQSLKSIVIPESAVTLGELIFSGCTSIEEITVPSAITAIPANFAAGCQALKKFDIPAGVTTIGEFAFSEAVALYDITLPDGITTLDRFCFAYTQALSKLAVPESVTTMGHGVFYQSALTEAVLPQNITVIPDGTFQCCALLKEFEVSDAVTEIEQEAFYWCFALEKITLGENVKTLGSKVFYGDTAIKEVTSKNTVPPTGATFEQDVYDLATLYVPASAEADYKAAEGWKEFKNVVPLQTGVEAVENGRFEVSVSGQTLLISADGEVKVFTTSGTELYSGPATELTLPAGLYIVTSGSDTRKVVL